MFRIRSPLSDLQRCAQAHCFTVICGFTLLASLRPMHSHRSMLNRPTPPLRLFIATCCPSSKITANPVIAPAKSARCRSSPTNKRARSPAPSLTPLREKSMPPWFADPSVGHFSNDPSLTPQQIATLVSWADANAPAGNPRDAPPPRQWTNDWLIPQPDTTIQMPKPVAIPATGDVEYTYEIVPTHFTEDKWVQFSEVRPSSRENVHHAVVYIRPPNSNWLKNAPVGVPFTGADMTDAQNRHDAHFTTADILLVYAPGSSPDNWPDGVAKFIPAGSDLVFQMHYMAHGHPARRSDQRRPGLRQAAARAARPHSATHQRPFRDSARRPRLSRRSPRLAAQRCGAAQLFPAHASSRQTIRIQHRPPGRRSESLLRVNYDFYWQLSYRLAEPRALNAGTDPPGRRVVRQLQKQSAQSRSRCRGALGRSNLRRNDGRILRCGGPCRHGQDAIFRAARRSSEMKSLRRALSNPRTGRKLSTFLQLCYRVHRPKK